MDPWVTTTTLLAGLGDPDNSAAWNRFVGRFRPIIVGCACRFGARQDEAEDIAQETLSAFLTAYLAGKYDPEKGRLRSWVFGIAKNQALKAIRARGGDRQMTSSFWPDQPDAETTWTKEWARGVLQQCWLQARTEMNPEYIEAFDLVVNQGMRAADVADRLGMPVKKVYNAKHRVASRLRELREMFEDVGRELS